MTTVAEIISEALESRLLDVHTALPGRILKYNAAAQTADIELQIKRSLLDDDEMVTSEEMPILPNVPIAFPRSAAFFISFPLAAGDFVFVIFAESSIDLWRAKGNVIAAGDIRRHTLTGGVAIPCLYPTGSALSGAHASDMVAGHDSGAQIHTKSGGTVEVTSGGAASADDYVAQSGKVESEIQTIVDAIKGAAVSAGDGGAVFKANIIAALNDPVGSTSSSNLKADD